jgi:hypothetical protein
MYPSEREGMCQNIGLPGRSATGQITAGWDRLFVRVIMSHPTSDRPGDLAVSAMLRLFERRLVPRHRTSQVGKIILHQRRPDTVCMVRDISPAGGLLFMSNAYGLPEEFNLQMDGYSRRCIARWRRLDRIGVQFKSTAAA